LTAVLTGSVRVPLNSGLAGAWDFPLLVTQAQLTGSGPPSWNWLQAAVFSTPLFWFSVRLSMVSTAQYTRAAQPNPVNCGTYPGPSNCNSMNAVPGCLPM